MANAYNAQGVITKDNTVYVYSMQSTLGQFGGVSI